LVIDLRREPQLQATVVDFMRSVFSQENEMASSEPLQRGKRAPDFALPGTDGRTWTRADVAGPKGLVVAFICNHCPYVQAVADRLVAEAKALRELGIGFVAISSNDPSAYAEDSFEHMPAFARRHAFDFPYLYDESQDVARAYGAACTPDFFGFNGDGALQYRGRLDAAGRNAAAAGLKRELYEAMKQVAASGRGPDVQTASVGCSIKWRAA
jgi:peroxiredoxin